ncbi:MAG: exosome complex exonuclease Rrp41 [Candidatus Micrarchaeota archaeon]|nr:exosome complex exonuclease Rrp41 [Candidatus Micrarchaeota archaeon]MDE1847452.1 exosome complex exonuclease Rrp41 [Candidatus Micrarchaeota archaeon]MDE1864053.1 exosome complex exonuclease Rrp41 [Candidatus Micrarchaeota archaeon]
MGSSTNKPELIVNGKRLDGRGFADLRPMKIIAGGLKNAAGSAYMEWGNNKVLAAVYGPKEALPKHTQDPDKAVIKCKYSMAPFSSLEEHNRSGPNRRAIEISKVTREVFEKVILREDFPGSEIDIFIEVLQSDGGTRAAGITTAAVALATSGIPMTDLPYAISVGKVGDTLILDLNKAEDNYSDADMPIAIGPRNNDILLLQMDGSLTKEQISEGLTMAKKAGESVARLQREALKAPYERILEKYKI